MRACAAGACRIGEDNGGKAGGKLNLLKQMALQRYDVLVLFPTAAARIFLEIPRPHQDSALQQAILLRVS